ncbi:MAG TPA: glucose-6-phosphate dehydrogenase, partial [Spirochaetota bacterium]|nr:glucose-6-phosphate dehydrogenase [Spirochaetota bacterium]
MKERSGPTIVIFGASGDLARRKLVPALWHFAGRAALPPGLRVIGTGRTGFVDQAYQEHIRDAVRATVAGVDPDALDAFSRAFSFVSIPEGGSFAGLKAALTADGGCGDCIFYLAVPPALYAGIAAGLAETGMMDERDGYRRLIVEKPFGYDLESARALQDALLGCCREDQIYRIDHYLGKETVQNILAFRFSNAIFESVWNRNYIDWVEITAAEELGVGKRGGYYDTAGALRDMVQNHMMQLLALVAMEPPVNFNPESLRNETQKVFQSLRPFEHSDLVDPLPSSEEARGPGRPACIRARYTGYTAESGIAPDSMTETFVAARIFIDNWRWGGVPFIVRTGKKLPVRVTEIVVHFKKTPHILFRNAGTPRVSNSLIIRIQPDEGLLLTLGLKSPGGGFDLRQVPLHFHYRELEGVPLSEAYERLILDCINGDPSLFIRGDAVLACWRFVQPVLEAWRAHAAPLAEYAQGSWGPELADLLLPPGERWREPCRILSEDGVCH